MSGSHVASSIRLLFALTPSKNYPDNIRSNEPLKTSGETTSEKSRVRVPSKARKFDWKACYVYILQCCRRDLKKIQLSSLYKSGGVYCQPQSPHFQNIMEIFQTKVTGDKSSVRGIYLYNAA
jgi:hypothetical protein